MLQLAPFHIPQAEESVSSHDWSSCVEAWKFGLRSYLTLSYQNFSQELRKSDSLSSFLVSYLEELCTHGYGRSDFRIESTLNYDCFSLIHRAWFSEQTPPSLLSASFLKQFTRIYGDVSETPAVLNTLWKDKVLGESQSMLKDKSSLQQLLDSGQHADTKSLHQWLYQARTLVKVCHEYGKFLMVGSDLNDAFIHAWKSGSPETRKKITLVTYAALLSLAKGKEKSLATLADHLYTLRVDHEKAAAGSSLLAALVTATPFLHKYRRIAAEAKIGRISDFLPIFERIGAPPPRQPVSKGKKAAAATPAEDLEQAEAAISQIQELFPELEPGFIARLLNEYDSNTEEVTARLLDNTLPLHLQNATRKEGLEAYSSQKPDHPAGKPTPSQQRRNIFDHDELDQLQFSTGKLHIGKKAETELSEPVDKKAIFSALATLDSDDDERDDTYDAEDVGGTVDMENPEYDLADKENDPLEGTPAERFLYLAWQTNEDTFSRVSKIRFREDRVKLRDETGLTDEAIVGWGAMLKREPKRLKKLQDRYSLGDSLQQDAIEDSEPHDEAGPADRGRGQSVRRGRGGRGRGRGRGGDVAGAANDDSTRRARQHKDANKGSRANHDRRSQRAKKMTRAGGP